MRKLWKYKLLASHSPQQFVFDCKRFRMSHPYKLNINSLNWNATSRVLVNSSLKNPFLQTHGVWHGDLLPSSLRVGVKKVSGAVTREGINSLKGISSLNTKHPASMMVITITLLRTTDYDVTDGKNFNQSITVSRLTRIASSCDWFTVSPNWINNTTSVGDFAGGMPRTLRCSVMQLSWNTFSKTPETTFVSLFIYCYTFLANVFVNA